MFAALWTGGRSIFRGVPSLGVANLGVSNLPSAGASAALLEPSPATVHLTPPSPSLPALCGPELSARHCLISSRTLLGRSALLGSRDAPAHGPGTSQRWSRVSIQKGAGRPGACQPPLPRKCCAELTRRRSSIALRRLGSHLCLLDCSMQMRHRPLCTGRTRHIRHGRGAALVPANGRDPCAASSGLASHFYTTGRGLKLTHGLPDRLAPRGVAGPCSHVTSCAAREAR